MGVDAVEPDVVVSKDGVLVVRHENEISGTTDVGEHSELADRYTTKSIDGVEVAGWFTEDFTWDELATLRCRERLPELRPSSASFDGEEPMLRLRDVFDVARDGAHKQGGREVGIVLEIKHATYFGTLGWDVAALVDAELREAGWAHGDSPLIIESFESTVLRQLKERGVRGSFMYLLEARGRAFDLVESRGRSAPTYRAMVAPAGLDSLVGTVDGISVDKRMLLTPDRLGRATGRSRIVGDAHERGLLVFTWTCRPENRFLIRQFRRGGSPSEFGDFEAEWAVIRDTGVDGVFVDHPDMAAGVFR